MPERDLGQNAAEQGDLELVERIERETAALDPLLAPLGRFSGPCRAMSASMPPAVRSAAGALAAPRRFPLAQAEGARGRAAPGRGGGDGGIRVRSGNAHGSCVASFARGGPRRVVGRTRRPGTWPLMANPTVTPRGKNCLPRQD